MCGIGGIISLSNEKKIDIDFLGKMTELVKHRGPDDMGMALISSQFTDKRPAPIECRTIDELRGRNNDLSNYNIGLGHRRLSIIDLSSKGHQPMSNEDRSLWIVHNGEIYNYIEIRQELIAKGYTFTSNTDTEVILYSYKEWGIDCLNAFNGMWAFAVWDCKKKTLFCSRDRFGIKPFYYYLNSEVFIFASEIKQILAYDTYEKKPNDRLIYDFLAIGLEDHTSETFFKDIYQLKGGEYALLDFKNKTFHKDRFYDLGKIQTMAGDESNYYQSFRDLFFDSVDIRLRSDVPVGSCLSGGLDSSAVVCTVAEILKRKETYQALETFTACWENEEIDERKYAEKIVAYSGTKGNNIFPSSEELHQDLSELMWHQEEPFGSLSIFAQWSVMKAARKRGIPVLLDGQGGDEVFLGYERYYAWFFMDLLKQGRFRKFIDELKKGSKNSKLTVAEIMQYYIYFTFNRVRALRLKSNAKKYMNEDFIRNYNLLHELTIFKYAKSTVDLQRIEIQETQLSHLLKYADRNSMAFSIETRLPFLDYRLVEFALSVPSELKIRNGWTKNIVREGMKEIVPEGIRKRKNKIGFNAPQAFLLEPLLPILLPAIEKESITETYINKRWLLDKINNNDINDLIVWKILCLGLWLNEFF